ncbi:hypothetical protein PGTUg99_002901 [Puccinia graminis f. sp. tritici]|uniref:Uncharacterized protein n=1 Tax=Puccinia graminis f. sp. tritici TaxID=56615 RepID=A0A5B0RHF1_PUCGR|nr:hypothetical protein PGTUg99_002901 [Puccinia graminis f. sp. tritici]
MRAQEEERRRRAESSPPSPPLSLMPRSRSASARSRFASRVPETVPSSSSSSSSSSGILPLLGLHHHFCLFFAGCGL